MTDEESFDNKYHQIGTPATGRGPYRPRPTLDRNGTGTGIVRWPVLCNSLITRKGWDSLRVQGPSEVREWEIIASRRLNDEQSKSAVQS